MSRSFRILYVLFFAASVASSQEVKSPIVHFLKKRGYIFPDSSKRNNLYSRSSQWPDTMYYNTMYKSAVLGSINIPISFSNIEFTNGQYVISPTVSLGLGYTWFFGDFTFNENDKITVYPTFFFGLIADAGLENNFSFNKLAGLFTGVFIGFGPFTLYGGYDLITQSPTLGLGARIDLYTISQNCMHVFGRVHAISVHKTIAQPIRDE